MRTYVALALVVVSGFVLAAPSAKVFADGPDNGAFPFDPARPTESPSITVESGASGVTIHISVTQTKPGGPGGTQSGDSFVSTGSQPSCKADAMNIGLSLSAWFQREAPLHPGESPWTVVCDDGFFAVVWIPRSAATSGNVTVVVGSGAVDPVVVAMELLNQLPIPELSIRANPSTGLVALESWFWVDGYGGEPISSSDTLASTTVEVQVQPVTYRWSFGDGTAIETNSLGRPFPEESDVQHVYEQSSLANGGAYSITIEVSFDAGYRVNTGPWESLAPIARTFTTDYPVQQLQSVLTSR